MSLKPIIRFDGQVAIVTGAGGGIGRSFAGKAMNPELSAGSVVTIVQH